MSKELIVGLVIGGLAAAALTAVAIHAATVYRKARATVRRWQRTRLVITQAPRRRTRARR